MVEGMNNLIVSVIIPTYNRAHLIGRAIESVLNQTYQHVEIIIVDDGSTDNTKEIVKEFRRQNDGIRYIKHEKNKGGAAARNTGIKSSTGYFLSFLDSDDQWLKNKLECDIKLLKGNKNCIICQTGQIFINEKTGKIIGKSNFKEKFVTQEIVLRDECSPIIDFTAVKEAVLTIEGFDEKLPARQDLDFWIRITSVGLGIQVPIYTSIHYVMRDDQISTGLKNKLQGTIILFEKHKNKFLSDSLAQCKVLISIGLMSLLNNSRAEDYFREAYYCAGNKVKRAKLAIILAIIKIFGNKGCKMIASYYKFTNPNEYLLW